MYFNIYLHSGGILWCLSAEIRVGATVMEPGYLNDIVGYRLAIFFQKNPDEDENLTQSPICK